MYNKWVCGCVCVCACVCVCVCACMHACACMRACVCACMCVCVRACVCVNIARWYKEYWLWSTPWTTLQKVDHQHNVKLSLHPGLCRKMLKRYSSLPIGMWRAKLGTLWHSKLLGKYAHELTGYTMLASSPGFPAFFNMPKKLGSRGTRLQCYNWTFTCSSKYKAKLLRHDFNSYHICPWLTKVSCTNSGDCKYSILFCSRL